jgi:hypothetical protein
MLVGQDRAEALESMREEVRQHEFNLAVSRPTRAETLHAIDQVPPGLNDFFAGWAEACSERWFAVGDRENAEYFLRLAVQLRTPKAKELQPCLVKG